MTPSSEVLAVGYEALFEPLARAAHRACLEHARLTRKDGWPTVKSCLDFANLYQVPPAEVAAFFGYLGQVEGGQTVWIDALRGPASGHFARLRATDAQARALGFVQMAVELPE